MKNARLIMGSRSTEGSPYIYNFSKSLWERYDSDLDDLMNVEMDEDEKTSFYKGKKFEEAVKLLEKEKANVLILGDYKKNVSYQDLSSVKEGMKLPEQWLKEEAELMNALMSNSIIGAVIATN